MTQRLSIAALVAVLFVSLMLLGCPSEQRADASDGTHGAPTGDTPAVDDPVEAAALEDPAGPCQIDRGCSEPAPIPNCTTDAASGPPEETAALESKIGQPVVLVGTLGGSLGCTEMACDDALPCCNGCSGSMTIWLSAPEGRGQEVLLLDSAEPNRFAVGGDETLACPPYVADVTVRAVGTLGRYEQGEFTLLDPVLCRPQDPVEP